MRSVTFYSLITPTTLWFKTLLLFPPLQAAGRRIPPDPLSGQKTGPGEVPTRAQKSWGAWAMTWLDKEGIIWAARPLRAAIETPNRRKPAASIPRLEGGRKRVLAHFCL